MPSITHGVGSFTADTIVSILRALPETDGTYAEIISRATEHGAQLSATTLSKWVTLGRADIEAGRSQTAYGRFAQRYDAMIDEHCSPDANRQRQLDRAFEILSGPASAATTSRPPPTAPWPTGVGSARTLTAADSSTGPSGPPTSQACHRTRWRSRLAAI